MMINAATSAALDRIAERAADVRAAYTPGATPKYGDVATDVSSSRFVLDPLSVAPPNDAYFVSTDDRGRTCYTRDGSFSIKNGTLVGEAGRPMLGYTTPQGPLCELHVDPVDAALGRAQNLHVEADGTLAYTRSAVDPRTGARENERVVVGRVALARFPAASRLGVIDSNRFLAPTGVPPHLGRPGDGNFGTVAPMQREASSIDIDQSLRRLKDAYLAFDALQAAHKAQGSVGKTAMDLLK